MSKSKNSVLIKKNIKGFMVKNFSLRLNINRLFFFLIACAIVLACAIPMEIWAINATEAIHGNGFIRINIIANDGIAFGSLSNSTGLIYFLQTLEIIVLIAVLIFSTKKWAMFFMGLAISGGAYNLIDRMVPKTLASSNEHIKNAVIDYFQFYDKSAIFNFSDIYILVGIIGFCLFLFIWLLIDSHNENKKKEYIQKMKQIGIIYENDDLIVVNKPKGLLTHSTAHQKDGTLFDAIKSKVKVDEFDDKTRAGIVQRLDNNTNGLMVIAKNKKTANALIEQIENKVLLRKYIAIVHNDFKDEKIIIKAPIARSKGAKLKFIVSDDCKAKDAQTEIKVIKHFKNAALIECTLKTGRTHQIRVHLSYINHPIYNDPLYGKDDGFGKYDQFLTSYYLRFVDPGSKKTLEFKVEPDETFVKLEKALENEKTI